MSKEKSGIVGVYAGREVTAQDIADAFDELEAVRQENEELKAKLKKSVELPCKIGDVVYTNITHSGDYERAKDRPYMHKVVFIGVNGKEDFFNTVNTKTGIMFTFNFKNIVKTVFLTCEEAEHLRSENNG